MRLGPALACCLVLSAAAARAQDFDGDAIPDSIEGESWYVAAGGSSTRADVWVECDYMAGTVKKRGKIVQRTEATFERAPVPGGITLHTSFDDKIPFEERWGNVQDENGDFDPEGYLETYERALEAYNGRFDGHPFTGSNAATMRSYVHYCVYINSMDVGGSILGLSLDSTTPYGGLPADMFLVALGQVQDEWLAADVRRAESGGFLHEFGHNLGLTHGGARPREHANLKPNYLSVMNYWFVLGFLRVAGDELEYFPYWDYSRFQTNVIHERKLDEEVGVTAPPEDVVTQDGRADDLYGVSICPDPSRALAFLWNRPRDWDCDNVLDTARVKVDTNDDGKKNKLGKGQDNWEHLVFDGGAIAGPGARRAPQFLDPTTEPDLPTLRRLSEEIARTPVDPALPP